MPAPAFPRTLASVAPCLALLLTGCGGEDARSSDEAGGSVHASPQALSRSSRDRGLGAARAALEAGKGGLALALLERGEGFEAECLRARAELQRGIAVAALAALERARAIDPDDAELLGTEVELLAGLDRLPGAAEALAAAIARRGAEPALLRAQGVLELRRSGHGEAALAALERARARDPELPFVGFPLAQAHLLVGRAKLEQAPAEAEAHALAARRLGGEAALDDALELQAEALAAELRFEEALARYEELEARGKSYGDTPAILHQRCATRMLLERDHDGAVRHYLAARRLGLDDEALGYGADVLRTEKRGAIEEGMRSAEEGRWSAAAAAFERALVVAPEDAEVENHLAAARFENQEYRAAAETWERALAHAQRTGRALEDPVPLDLAKAWRLAGEPERARTGLERLLDADPDGRWSAGARELLLALEAEALAGR